ncbi:hypothetical protein [Paenibacillus sp. oral taxon 786]|uniref:hypothetical protein n=1 Tax=Paenibacillus sp. oral taxon 786 TaxID=652715 RepID=UPI0018DDEDB8|nr:hypothetical protein [Paenibacillus sp. oral taxon 786]
MTNTKALVVGVSNYYDPAIPNLPFCKNDVSEVRKALRFGLKIGNEDIITPWRIG